jgi:hypothetical protein
MAAQGTTIGLMKGRLTSPIFLPLISMSANRSGVRPAFQAQTKVDISLG